MALMINIIIFKIFNLLCLIILRFFIMKIKILNMVLVNKILRLLIKIICFILYCIYIFI